MCTKFRFSSTLFAGDITRKVNPLDLGLLDAMCQIRRP